MAIIESFDNIIAESSLCLCSRVFSAQLTVMAYFYHMQICLMDTWHLFLTYPSYKYLIQQWVLTIQTCQVFKPKALAALGRIKGVWLESICFAGQSRIWRWLLGDAYIERRNVSTSERSENKATQQEST